MNFPKNESFFFAEKTIPMHVSCCNSLTKLINSDLRHSCEGKENFGNRYLGNKVLKMGSAGVI
jgi:hypothetical protein